MKDFDHERDSYMPDYQKMYFTLVRESSKAIDLLQDALREAEEIYINAPDTPLAVLPCSADNEPPPSPH